ncbi:MAG TPA: ABC transporter substrate-binding protein [Nocardioides sp.]|nr:ABC transporter substrate-binding protein [Nocardioides sp.]
MPPSIFVRRRARRPALALLLTLTFPLAACGGVDTVDDERDSSAPDSGSEFPVSVVSGPMGADTEITIEDEPSSIISLSPTATEMLWAVGAGDQVVAVDDQSDYPEDVPVTELSGYEPNVEAILAQEPDLVLTESDQGDLVAGLEKARVPTLILPSAGTLEESYDEIERVGAATGHDEEATALVADMKAEIEAALEDAPDAKGLTYFHELTPDLYTAGGGTFIGEVYGLFGLENIADEAGDDDYPQLSDEYVVSTDPDLIFLSDGECCGVGAADVEKRPGWGRVDAVVDDQVHVVNEDIASRWGPRVVDFVRLVSEILSEREQALGASGS